MKQLTTLKINNFKKSVFCLLLVASLFFLSDTFATSISPLRQTLTIDPGSQEEVGVTILNDKDILATYEFEVDAFKIDERSGVAVFGESSSAKRWITPNQKKITLSPGESEEIKFLVDVPLEAERKSYYLGLFAKEVGTGDGEVAVSSRVGSLFFLHISGEIEEDLSKQLFAPDKRIYLNNPVKVSLWLRNDGTIHEEPLGKLKIFKKNGRILQNIPINPERRKVLPSANWKADYVLNNLPWYEVGPIDIQLSLTYGLDQKQLNSVITVWYLPVWIFIFLGFLFGLLILFWKYRRNKKYEK